ncbi:hypothetical protein ACJ41O_010234 [Fusarium nematophilum]
MPSSSSNSLDRENTAPEPQKVSDFNAEEYRADLRQRRKEWESRPENAARLAAMRARQSEYYNDETYPILIKIDRVSQNQDEMRRDIVSMITMLDRCVQLLGEILGRTEK